MNDLRKMIGLGATVAAFAIAVPLINSTPVWAQIQEAGQSLIENLQRQPAVKLELSAEKKIIETDEQGQPKITWQSLTEAQGLVQPNDVLRYSLNGQNTSDRPIRNLVITQPIPDQMQYVLNSATITQTVGAEITYSIDSGRTFVTNPTIEVTLPDGTVETRPAPAEDYTHIRWNFGTEVSTNTVLNATYQAEIQ